ncbi:MICAL-like protein 2 isoform X2 [Ptychodera flava]|uniref:MICAL-like protein 2 isoform X2 n=1 Tax=Ptychodera flava TaxID=63121 RepID=UPI00396A385E
MALSGMKALQVWCQRVTEGYRDVKVVNMSSSWKDGLAFCAILHHFRPDIIDFDSLKKGDVYENNKLAFETAERELGITALLDPEDMVAMDVPDKLCIMTYVSQYYNYFKRQTAGGIKPAKGLEEHPPAAIKTKKAVHDEKPKDRIHEKPKEKVTEKPKEKVQEKPKEKSKVDTKPPGSTALEALKISSKGSTFGDKCAACGKKVYLLERQVVDGKLYHRACFRCRECKSTLRPGTYSILDGNIFECTLHKKDNRRYGGFPRGHARDKKSSLEREKDKKETKPANAPKHTSNVAAKMQMYETGNKSEPAKADKITSNAVHVHVSPASKVTVKQNDPSSGNPPPLNDAAMRRNLLQSLAVVQKRELKKFDDIQTDSVDKVPDRKKAVGKEAEKDNTTQKKAGSPESGSPVHHVNLKSEDEGPTKQGKGAKESAPWMKEIKLKRVEDQTEQKPANVTGNKPEVESVPVPRTSKAQIVLVQKKVTAKIDDRERESERLLSKGDETKKDKGPEEVTKDVAIEEEKNKKENEILEKSVPKDENKDEKESNPFLESDEEKPPDDSEVKDKDDNAVAMKEKEKNPFLDSGEEEEEIKEPQGEITEGKVVAKEVVVVNIETPKVKPARADVEGDDVTMETEKDEKKKKIDVAPTEGQSIEGAIATPEAKEKDVSETHEKVVEKKDEGQNDEKSEEQKKDESAKDEKWKEDDVKDKKDQTETIKEASVPETVKGKEENEIQKNSVTVKEKTDEKPSEEMKKKKDEEEDESYNPFFCDDDEEEVERKEEGNEEQFEDYNPFSTDFDEDEEELDPSKNPFTGSPVDSEENLVNPFTGSPILKRKFEYPAAGRQRPSGVKSREDVLRELQGSLGRTEKKVPPPRPPPPKVKSQTLEAGSKVEKKDITASPGTPRKGKAAPLPPGDTGFSPTRPERRSKRAAPPPPPGAGNQTTPKGKPKAPPPPPPVVEVKSPEGEAPAALAAEAVKPTEGTSTPPAAGEVKSTEPTPTAPSVAGNKPIQAEPSGSPTPPPRSPKSKRDETSAETPGGVSTSLPGSPALAPRKPPRQHPEAGNRKSRNLSPGGAGDRARSASPGVARSVKRKAPLPPPQKRKLYKSMSPDAIKAELNELDQKQTQLEEKGVELEKKLREKEGMEGDESQDNEEDMLKEWFELINEKNGLVRRENELLYLNQQQNLEEEHAEVEYELRCLLQKDENVKTEEDKKHEEELIERLVEIVHERNRIVETMEQDRIREYEEDKTLEAMMIKKGWIEGEDHTVEEVVPEKKEKGKKEEKKKEKHKDKKDKDKKKDKVKKEEKKKEDDEKTTKTRHGVFYL